MLALAFFGAGLTPLAFMALLAAAAVTPVVAGLLEMKRLPAHE
jgi:hypothetical protein